MSQVNETSSAGNILSHLNINNKPQEKKTNELGQSAFLELMITQMNNQDPLSPQDNTEFVAQLAQFSSVEGLERLNSNFQNFSSTFMSNQALQASSLVGRSVTVEAESARLMPGDIISGSVDLSGATSDLSISIFNKSGGLVAQIPVGTAPKGETVFRWDGENIEVNGELLDWQASEAAPAGEYRFEVYAKQDGKVEQLATALSANVNSVTLGNDGTLTLNLAGVGPINIADVKQFN
jgi:flagellar basal-body rod modification protein FlgD